MKLILHDLNEEYADQFLPIPGDDIQVFSALPRVKMCVGCMGCWLKTPGLCVIEDRGQDFQKLMARADELHIVSRLLYGGPSTDVKAVLDRTIGHLLPFFCITDKGMNHPPRYDVKLKLRYHLYSGDDTEMSQNEILTMEGFAKANAKNYDTDDVSCTFYDNISKLTGAFK